VKTEVLTVSPEAPSVEALERAGSVLRDGGLVVLPTETVYGIAARWDRAETVARLLEVRHSPQDKHLTIHLADLDGLIAHVSDVPVFASRLIRRFWPGPLTVVFRHPRGADSEPVGIRIPSHPVASGILARAGGAVVIPSANRSGERPAIDARQVIEAFDGKVDLVIDGGPCRIGTASTVVRIGHEGWEVLRDGAIPTRLLADLDYRTHLFVCTGNTCRSPMAAGLFRHRLARRLGVPEDALPERGIHVLSAGTDALTGTSCSPMAAEMVASMGGGLSRHVSQGVTSELLETSDHIYVMTRSHQQTLGEWAPEAGSRVRTLDPSGRDIEDPIGGGYESYRRVAEKILSFLDGPLAQAEQEAVAWSSRR